MSRSMRVTMLLVAILAAACTPKTNDEVAESTGDVAIRDPGANLKTAMRKLWADHVIWTREYIVAAVAGDSSASAAAARLMKNQEDLGNAIVPYYGSEAGAKLTDLLKQHITIAVDLVAAAKAKDNAKLTDADKRWHDNARDIATFLSGANPNWSMSALQDMLNEHLAMTTEEAKARLEKRWQDDAATFDRIFDQAMHMADALADGIVKQFPNKV